MKSVDLRRSILAQYEAGGVGLRELAVRAGGSVNMVQGWRELLHETGDVVPRPHGGGRKPKLDERNLRRLELWLEKDNDLTDDELVAMFKKIGVTVSRPTVNRAAHKRGISRKKRPASRLRHSVPRL